MTRATWTDERMDDLSKHVDEGFERVDRRLDRIEDRLTKAEENSARQFGRLDSKFDQLALSIVRVGGGLIVTMAIGFAGLLAS